MTVEPGSPRWRELVQMGVNKDADRNWSLGDAALEIAPMGDSHGHNGAETNLREYAEEIGVAYESLDVYRKVAQKWPQGTRVPSASWKVHQLLTARQDEVFPGMTVAQARRAIGEKLSGRMIRQGVMEDRVELVRSYLADPEVARQVIEDDPSREAVLGAFEERSEERGAERAAKEEADPVSRAIKASNLLLDLGSACARFSLKVRELMPQLGPCPEGECWWLTRDLERLDVTVGVIRDYVHSGETRVSEDIAEIMERKSSLGRNAK